MVTFLIIISFCIHGISLAAIYVLYKQGQQSGSNHIKEIDQLMHSYIAKIQQENTELQKTLHKQSNLIQIKQDKNDLLKPVPLTFNERKDEFKAGSQKQWDPLSIIEAPEDTIETSLESRVLQRYRDGMTAHDIARELHCGKTEASLIIQFQSKD